MGLWSGRLNGERAGVSVCAWLGNCMYRKGMGSKGISEEAMCAVRGVYQVLVTVNSVCKELQHELLGHEALVGYVQENMC